MSLNLLTWQRCLVNLGPSGTIEITENGEYDVSHYATADVSVSGGSSDFSVAEVTLNITLPEGYEAEIELVTTRFEYPSDEFPYQGYIPKVEGKADIILYDGTGYISEVIAYSIADNYPLDLETMTLSGDIVYDSDNQRFVVTGNCTISGSYVVE